MKTTETLYAHCMPSPVGTLLLAVNEENALVALRVCEAETPEAFLNSLASPGKAVVWDEERCEPIARQLRQYFCGERQTFDVPLAPRGTAFQQQVWAALLTVPYGTTSSYQELAARIGRPSACRAVGQANGANPIAIVIPCHRIVGANQTLTGYAYGVERKQKLLQLEGACASADLFTAV